MEVSSTILIISGILGLLLFVALISLFFISRKSQKVMDSLLLIMTKPERAKIQDASHVLQTILSDEISKIEANFIFMQKVMAGQIAATEELKKELYERNQNMVELADESVRKISVMSGRLENTVSGLQSVVGSNGWAEVESTTEKFTNRVNDLCTRIDTTYQEAMEKISTLQNNIDGWIESGKQLSEMLHNEIVSNTTNLETMATESGNVQTKLSELSVSVASGFDNVKTAAKDYEVLLKNNDELLGGHLEKMDTFTRQSKTLLNTQMNNMTNTSNAVGGQIRLVEASIEKQVKKLTEAVESLMAASGDTEASVRNVSTELATLTNRFNGEIKEFAIGVVGELNTVSGVANVTLENTKTAANAFSESVRAMATGVRETLMEMNTAHTQLTSQSAGLIKMSSETTSQLQPLSELIEKYYSALPELSSGSAEMAENLEKIVSSLNNKIHEMKDAVADSLTTVGDSSLKLEQLSSQSRQQMIDLMSDYAKAVNTMQTLNKQMMVARATAPMDAIKAPVAQSFGRISSNDFIKQSEKLIDKLHEQSVDLTKATGAEIPDTVLKKYHAGDKTIFTKWFAKMLGAADKKQVQQLLKSDSVFRSQATQFVRSFGQILSGAQQSDDTEMLTSTLLRTELGQVYSVLKNYV